MDAHLRSFGFDLQPRALTLPKVSLKCSKLPALRIVSLIQVTELADNCHDPLALMVVQKSSAMAGRLMLHLQALLEWHKGWTGV